ncbi:MAG: hypothetical protein ACOYN8_01350 [Pseudanabaena sp.]
MTENKTKEVIDRVSQQVGQTWTKVQPQLQALLLKLVKSLLPTLRTLQTKLTTAESDVSSDSSDQNDQSAKAAPDSALDKALDIGKSLSAKTIGVLIVALTNLQKSLSSETINTTVLDANGEPVALLNASAEDNIFSSPLAKQVKQEFGIAWKFVKEQVTPKILQFLQFSVDKLDPIATNIWQKVSTKVAATPSLANSWEKLQSNTAWKQTVTATAPIWRSMSGIAEQVPLSTEVKQIVDKRAGAIALVILFSLLLILKPSHAHSQNFKKVATSPAPISSVNQKQPISAPSATEPPLTAEQIAIAKIQTQVSEVASHYGEALLGSVQPNFKRGRLIVALNDSWYQLEPTQQTQLVTDLQTQSRSLNFKKLLVADAENHLIARSPVTGDQVIILRN